MKAKCRQWTKDESVFAVIDTYAWHDDNQLCVAKDGNTPLISGWTTVGDQLRQGSPNLWWTGPEQIATLENLTSWAMSTGVLTKSTKFGIVYADRANDRLVKQQFASILARAGLTPKDTETMHYSAVDQSQAQAQGAVAVHNFQSQGVTVVFPLIPFTTFAVFLANAKSQSYKPRLLLSDFEQTVGGALGLLDAAQFDEQLDNQLGTTTMVLGNTDGPRGTAPNSPGYGPQEMSCYQAWLAHNPHYGDDHSDYHGYLESTGTAMAWCQNIRLFAQAATAAGTNLTRPGYVAAMGRTGSFPSTVVPTLGFGPGKPWGPQQFRVVKIHKNSDHACPPKEYDPNSPQGTCWLIQQDFQPLRHL